MEKLNEIAEMKLRTNKNKLHQTDARIYKDKLHELFIEKFQELDLDITLVENGFIIEMPHSELGSVPIEAKFVIKSLDFDVISSGEQYQEKLSNQAKKLEEKKKGI